MAGDVRAQTGVQDFVGTAPLNLVYVSNAEHMSGVSREEQHRFAAADIGFIGQNVYLYCASEGLACVFRASLDTVRLARTLGLGETQFIMFSQTVRLSEGVVSKKARHNTDYTEKKKSHRLHREEVFWRFAQASRYSRAKRIKYSPCNPWLSFFSV